MRGSKYDKKENCPRLKEHSRDLRIEERGFPGPRSLVSGNRIGRMKKSKKETIKEGDIHVCTSY